jgi:cytochrome c peroxidase
MKKTHLVALCATGLLMTASGSGDPNHNLPNLFPFPNNGGVAKTLSTAGGGDIDLSGPFFQSLGTNGRSCGSCHKPDQAWSISADGAQQAFQKSAGMDPMFRTNDGANCDHNIDVSTLAGRREAYSLLTSRGLIRVAIAPPADADFTVESVNNPYGCGELSVVSTYRRPLPTTNLKFLSAVMWDGRESTPPFTQKISFATNPGDLLADLAHQAVDATDGHAQGAVKLTALQQKQIVNFEMSLYSAQSLTFRAGNLDGHGATGGPEELAKQPFFIGINDPLGGNPNGTDFTPTIFDLFDEWTRQHGDDGRASVLRGQAIFNSKRINITGVPGLNDVLGVPVIPGNCGTCHDSPNVGNHSAPLPIDIGVADVASPLDTSYLPVVTLKQKSTGNLRQTTDPGRALITGKWSDIGKFKGPVLRSLAARAPYFHNGSAATLDEVLDFYNARFAVGLTVQEKRDLVNFLNAL